MKATHVKANPTRRAEELHTPEKPVDVSPEELRHLAECCAFFKAEHFREAAPETIRAADIVEAEDEIEQVIESCGCLAAVRECRENADDDDR
jgi:hypothetical protein